MRRLIIVSGRCPSLGHPSCSAVEFHAAVRERLLPPLLRASCCVLSKAVLSCAVRGTSGVVVAMLPGESRMQDLHAAHAHFGWFKRRRHVQVDEVTVVDRPMLKKAVGAAALGGPVFLTPAQCERIAGRPDEHYRQKMLGM